LTVNLNVYTSINDLAYSQTVFKSVSYLLFRNNNHKDDQHMFCLESVTYSSNDIFIDLKLSIITAEVCASCRL